MSLPKIDLPIYELVLPSNGKKIKYRAFTVKEEKILLTAKESDDPTQNLLAIKQVLNNCIFDQDIEKLSVFDVEYLLLMIRGKSVNNVIDFIIQDPDTNEDIKLSVNIDDVKILRDERHNDKIRINDEYTMFMKYPNIDVFKSVFANGEIDDPLAYYDVMISCIGSVSSKDTVYKLSDFSRAEVDDFIENLDGNVIELIKLFFETMPRLRHEVKYKNKDGKENTFVIEGTDSFFI